MNIDSLKYFYMIAKEGNISNVAKHVHISQSALSQQIQKLESELGSKLMERSNKGVSLTPVGEIVYRYASKSINIYEQMLNAMREYEKENNLVKIKASHSIADYALPCTLMLANKRYPLHRYELSSGSVEEIVANVSNNIYDLGFTYSTAETQIDDDNVAWTKIGTNKIVLVGKYDTKAPKKMTVEQLMGSCMITFTGESDITETLFTNFEKLGYTVGNVGCNLEVRTIESAKTLVSKGHGVAFLPYISVKEELYKKEFMQIEVPEFNMDMELVMLFNQEHTTYVHEFITWFNKQGKASFC